MTIKYSTLVNNARLDAIESQIAPSTANATLKIYGGTVPTLTTDTPASPTPLVTMTLTNPWLASASGGILSKSGTWTGTATAGGTATFFRINDASGNVVGIQGTCGIGTGDMWLDNTSIANTQVVTVNSFQITAGNA